MKKGVIAMIQDLLFQWKMERLKNKAKRYQQEQKIKKQCSEYFNSKKKRKVSNVMLTLIVLAIMGYTVASFWLQYHTGTAVDSTLTSLYYGFWTVELIALTTIKNNKTKYGTTDTNE